MNNFTRHNPVKLVFGQGTIATLPEHIPAGRKILFTYGGGSIKKNGVYRQVREALSGFDVFEFGGIRPNPSCEHLAGALPLIRREKIDFLLAVGGGSVLDGTKFIALAARHEGGNPWEIMSKKGPSKGALPIGTVLTIPGTGSEANAAFVISREETREKLGRVEPSVFPAFSIIDPTVTFTLPDRQVANGIADAFIHICEQYLTGESGSPLQARQAEAVLATLVEERERIMARPPSLEARANFAWCATQALDGLVSCGVRQDWATHTISHELTALYGLDHARALAVVLPALLRHEANFKKKRLLQYGARIWGLSGRPERELISGAIEKTADFFRSLSIPVKLSDHGVEAREAGALVAERVVSRQGSIGEERRLGKKEIGEIFDLIG